MQICQVFCDPFSAFRNKSTKDLTKLYMQAEELFYLQIKAMLFCIAAHLNGLYSIVIWKFYVIKVVIIYNTAHKKLIA